MNNQETSSERNRDLLQLSLAAILIFLAAILRILPHPWNVTPVGAMAIFAGSVLRRRWAAYLLPLAALLAGDVFVGLHKLMFVVYASFALSVAIGQWLAQSRTIGRLGGATVLGAVQFFLVSNFAMWAMGGFYPKTWIGLTTCFLNAIPFFWNTLAGDAIYATVLFGGYAFAERFLQSYESDARPV
jgi:hypothetical protein